MPKEMMYGEAIATAIIEEMQRDSSVIFYGQNMGMTERDPMLGHLMGLADHPGPHPHHPDFRNGRTRRRHRRGNDRPAANRGIVDERIHAGGLRSGCE